jgi:hypothetical protein
MNKIDKVFALRALSLVWAFKRIKVSVKRSSAGEGSRSWPVKHIKRTLFLLPLFPVDLRGAGFLFSSLSEAHCIIWYACQLPSVFSSRTENTNSGEVFNCFLQAMDFSSELEFQGFYGYPDQHKKEEHF